jgi:hypothetical protein
MPPEQIASSRARKCPRCGAEDSSDGATEASSRPRAAGRVAAASVLAGVDPPELAAAPAAAGDALSDPSGDPAEDDHELAARAATASKRYGLPMSMALQVAGQRLSLAEALHLRALADERKAELDNGLASWVGWAGAFASVACALVGAAIWTGIGGLDDGPMSRAGLAHVRGDVAIPTIRAAREVQVDAAGRVTAIRAQDPEAVLAAYCDSFKKGPRPVPVRIGGRGEAARVGVFRLGESLRSIAIQKDPGTIYWIAGSGKAPIATESAAALPTEPSEIAR